MVFATKQQLDKLEARLDQLDADMAAIASAIKRNNSNTQAILDAIAEEKQRTKLIGLQ